MLNIRPVSDLRNKYPEIEQLVLGGEEVYLTKNGYGSMVVMSIEQYSALTVYRKLDLPSLFDDELSEEEFDDISFIMANLIDEGPVAGISAVENAMEVIGSYLTLAEKRSLTAEVCYTVYGIFGIEPFADRAKKILQSEECRNIIAEEVKRGIMSALAEYLGLGE